MSNFVEFGVHAGYVKMGLRSSGYVLYGCGRWTEGAKVVKCTIKVQGVGIGWYV